MNRLALGLLAASAWLLLFHPVGAVAQPVPLGPETRVDTIDGKEPGEPSLAVQPGGDFEIAWGYLSTDPPFVAARHFAADGTPMDAAQVPLGGPGPYPRVKSVTATQGGFEVLWQLEVSYQRPSYRRHLDLNGTPEGKPVRLGKGAQWVWQVRGHGFLSGWQAQPNNLVSGVSIQRLSPTGQRTGAVVRLNTRPVYVDERPLLTALADGGFLALWNGLVQVGKSYFTVLRARRFSAAGKPLGPDFDVDSIADTAQDSLFFPRVAASPAGGFAVAWWFFDASAGTGTGIATPYVRLFDTAGKPRGPEIAGSVTQYVESLAFDDAGNLLVLWAADSTRSPADLEVQVFGPNGAPLGPQERVATEASGTFSRPFRGSVAWGGSSWIVTWVAETDSNHPRPRAIFVRQFAGE